MKTIFGAETMNCFKGNIVLIKRVFVFIMSFILLSSLLSIQTYSFTDDDEEDIYNLSFSELSMLKISSATKVEQDILEVPSTIYVISSEKISENGYFTLEELLADLPGFQFRNIQGFNSYSFQRGIPNQNNLILILIDGVQVNELNSGGFYGGGQYNLSNVERVEVVYGPGSVAYGTNAVTGVINIITKSALKKEISLRASAGTFNTLKADASLCYANENKTFGIRASAMVKKTDKADISGKNGDYNWTDLLDNFEDDYAFDLKVKFEDFTFGTNFLQKQTSFATYNKSIGTIYKDYGTLWNIRFINNYLKYNKKISEKLSIVTTLYNRNATVIGNSIQYVTDTAQIGVYRPNNLSGLEGIFHYKTGKNFSMAGGATLEYESLAKDYSITVSDSPEEKPDTPNSPEMEKNYLASIFLEPQLSLLSGLYFSGGFRFDHSSVYDNVFTPRVGMSYKLNRLIIRASYAEAFRAPRPWDYTNGLGNKSLVPEKMTSFEGAISYLLLDNFKIDFIVYNNSFKNAITMEKIGDDFRWVNEGMIKTKGFEFGLFYSTNKCKVSLNYTFNESTNQDKKMVPEISKHIANASITYAIIDDLKLNLRANYLGERENPKLINTTNSNMIDQAIILNACLTFFNFEGFDFQLVVKNILDAEYYHTSNRTPDRYRQAQRSFMLSIGYSLTE